MTKEDWNYGMLETQFSGTDMPSYEEYMDMIEDNLKEPEVIEPLFSGRISGRDEYWTFLRHRTEPRKMYELCSRKISHVKSFSHCYSFKRFRGERMANIIGGKHRYIGITRVPEAEEFDESELKELMKRIESNTPFHVAWISKTRRPDDRNAYFLLTGNVEPGDIEKHRQSIDNQIKANKSEILFIQKFAHHKSHKKPMKEKQKAIKDYMPEDHVNHELLKEYESFHWSR